MGKLGDETKKEKQQVADAMKPKVGSDAQTERITVLLGQVELRQSCTHCSQCRRVARSMSLSGCSAMWVVVIGVWTKHQVSLCAAPRTWYTSGPVIIQWCSIVSGRSICGSEGVFSPMVSYTCLWFTGRPLVSLMLPIMAQKRSLSLCGCLNAAPRFLGGYVYETDPTCTPAIYSWCHK